MIPIIRKIALLNEWVIITRYSQKEGYSLAHTKYPVPPNDISYIANDYLISHLKGCKIGYSYHTGSEEDSTLCRVTVERISKCPDLCTNKDVNCEDCVELSQFKEK
jgi:hypothetical protein